MEAEDQKLVVLARATRARTGAPQGAALRDQDGRTYAASGVDLPSLRVSAVGVVVAMAVSSGATSVEAVVVLGGDGPSEADLAAVRELAGPGVPVHRGTAAGVVEDVTTT